MHRIDPTMPPLHVLDAIRQPRRVQLGDRCVKELFRRWRLARWPIDYADLWEVAALLGVDEADAATRRRIVEATEAAGVAISNFDDLREFIGEGGTVSMTGDGFRLMTEEERWRWPESEAADISRQGASAT